VLSPFIKTCKSYLEKHVWNFIHSMNYWLRRYGGFWRPITEQFFIGISAVSSDSLIGNMIRS